jgi:hypothetical protein
VTGLAPTGDLEPGNTVTVTYAVPPVAVPTTQPPTPQPPAAGTGKGDGGQAPTDQGNAGPGSGNGKDHGKGHGKKG